MISATSKKLDFDYLTGLAQSDPSAFERYREKAIDAYISTLPDNRQERMRRLQWRIDQVRHRHSPMGACIKLSGMMWDHLLGPQGLLGLLENQRIEVAQRGKCAVVPFPSKMPS